MGNSASSSGRGHHDESVDFGHLTPQGVYTGPRDWNQAVVSQFICSRRLAPFYRPLEEYDESWDDDQILNARKELPESEMNESSSRADVPYPTAHSRSSHNKRPGLLKEPSKPEAAVYRGAVECPICFLYYPPNINHSRCCDQAICTECFVQIKRSEPTTTHLVSEPAACPYCVQDNFGVVYNPPPWRAGIGGDNTAPLWLDSLKGSQNPTDNSTPYPTHKRRQKSFGADSPEVVTTDQIRPDWEAKLTAVRAAVTRRANRRIIMRQVGDRLIPVGVTSGRVHALSPEEAAAEGADGGSRRSRRRQQQQGQNQNFEQFMGMAGQDLEELMLMEAMRLSLLDHEEQQRKEAEEKKKLAGTSPEAEPAANSGDASGPGPSTNEPHPSNPISFLSSSPSSSQLSSNSSSAPQIPPQEQESLSRTRTPSPAPPTNHSASTGESSSSWRRRVSNPPPFSTLTAALSAASMANAILGDNSKDNSSPTASSMEEDASRPLTGRTAAGGSVPAIMIGEHNGIGQHDFDVDPNASTTTGAPNLSQRLKPFHHDSLRSGTSIDIESTYDPLLSSPESAITHEPLLGHQPESSSPAPPKRATTSEGVVGETNG